MGSLRSYMTRIIEAGEYKITSLRVAYDYETLKTLTELVLFATSSYYVHYNLLDPLSPLAYRLSKGSKAF